MLNSLIFKAQQQQQHKQREEGLGGSRGGLPPQTLRPDGGFAEAEILNGFGFWSTRCIQEVPLERGTGGASQSVVEPPGILEGVPRAEGGVRVSPDSVRWRQHPFPPGFVHRRARPRAPRTLRRRPHSVSGGGREPGALLQGVCRRITRGSVDNCFLCSTGPCAISSLYQGS